MTPDQKRAIAYALLREAEDDEAAQRTAPDLNVKAAAAIVGVSDRQMYRLAPHVGVKHGRVWVISPAALNAVAKGLAK